MEFLRDEGGISSGNATSLTIFNTHRSACSSERPTHVRSGARTDTCEALGEWDADRTTGGASESSEDSEGSVADTLRRMLVREESVPLLDRVMTVAEFASGYTSRTEDESSGEMGDNSGDICDVSWEGSEEYKSNPAAAINATTF